MADDYGSEYDGEFDPRIGEAQKFLQLAADADSNNRAEAQEDLKFAAGDQWPVEIQNSRTLEARPCLTINKIDAYIKQITNQQRQQRPRIKVHGMNNESDEKVAQILQGICRHIEVNSNADTAYDEAFDYAVRMGWGYWRVVTDYISEDSFDQEIYIEPIHNPFTVYFDPNSILPDGSDAEKCLITEVISKNVFRSLYPDADDTVSFTQRATGDVLAEWVMKEDIRIAEYFYTERRPATLIMLSDGTKLYKDELKDDELEMMAANGIIVVDERPSYKKVIKWCKLTAMQVLEEREWPGKFIPVIPVYGQRLFVESKRKKFGLVRMAKDPQRMYNFWQTSITESVALAPKAKWLLAEGQDEGHENEWVQANIKSTPVLRYKQTDIEGRPAPVPTRLQPEPPPAGILAASASINEDLQAVLGVFDPNQMPTGNISGKALMGQQQQIDLTNYHYYDNLTRSIKHTGKILLDLIPHIYDSQRVMRIIGEDAQPEMVTINEPSQTEEGVYEILNDVTVGQYDVVMDTGPGYNSKRLEAVNSMMPLMQGNEQLFQMAGDLFIRNMDFPGSDVIADRLAAMNPMAQIDEKSKIPPMAQMKMKQMEDQNKQLQDQLIAMQLEINNRSQVAQIKEEGANKRKLMDVTSRAHNTETMAEVKVNDQNTRAITSQNKTEIDAIVELMLHHMDTQRLINEIEKRNAEQMQYANVAAQDIDQGQNPFMGAQ
jgi:hypothetical protein